MIHGIVNYIKEKEFRFTVFLDRVHIINYEEVLSLEENRISVSHCHGRMVIKGDGLSVNRLLEQEILIMGKVKVIEMNQND